MIKIKATKRCAFYVLEQWYTEHISSVKRHFETNHKSFCEKSEPEQKELIASAIKDRNKQSTSMFKYVSKNCHTSAASYSAANAIARHGKPFQEGEFLKEAWLKRYYYKKLQVLPKLKKNIKDLDSQEKRNEEKVIDDFISIMDSLINEFSARFSQFKELLETFKFVMYPDVISFDKLNLSQFNWLEIEELEMQLIDFQSSSIWIQKFIETRKNLELIEAERLISSISKYTSNEILEAWNSTPDAFNCLKKLAYAILTIFSSTYACESLFSEINNIKDSLRNRLIDESNSACILLKKKWHVDPIRFATPGLDAEILTYRLKTVTYGLSNAPFLAIRTLQQLAKDEKSRFPLASETLLYDMYMDDIVSGALDLETAQQLQLQLKDALQSCGMNLHKWSSNSPELLNSSLSLDAEHSFSTGIDISVKTLGISWKPFEDCFVFKVSVSAKYIYIQNVKF
ncbi:uncharacterized protein TNCV_776411 [Trichonephila clavipes]|nr:uncharacterized protein TNCV_776411 [Trichonephila clavipes]